MVVFDLIDWIDDKYKIYVVCVVNYIEIMFWDIFKSV